METKEMVERIDGVKSYIRRAFDLGSIDFDAIVKELETLVLALEQIGEMGDAGALTPALPKSTAPIPANLRRLNACDYR